jgi:biotin-dependent carboxylase-like uncharacterized protein
MTGGPGGGLLVVERAGLHTTVQDEGRWGYQHLGVPVGGALDLDALHRANGLVGNLPGEAALEVTLVGCTIRAQSSLDVAVTGARFDLRVNGREVAHDTALGLGPGDVLVLGERRRGARAYLAVRGGVEAPVVLGSRSAWPLLARRGALHDGAWLSVGDRVAGPVGLVGTPTPPPASRLRVLPGPDATAAPDLLAVLCGGAYRVAPAASRMAYPLEGPTVPLLAPDRPSSGTVTGALQILPSGQPVLLMAERQTTGGYPIAAIVISADLTHAAQLAPGDPVQFTTRTRAEALRALWTAEEPRRGGP